MLPNADELTPTLCVESKPEPASYKEVPVPPVVNPVTPNDVPLLSSRVNVPVVLS
jgi:hypothetical protein